MTALLALAAPLLYVYALFAAYILVMGVQRAHLSGRLTGPLKWLCMPMVLIGYTMDCIANLTLASLVFWEWPRELLVPKRLLRLIAAGTAWRRNVAMWICDHLLDPFDPRGDHC